LTSTALALTTGDLLALHEGAALERVAVVDGKRCLTYRDMQQRVQAAAAQLAELGVRRGDRVIVHLRKSSEEVVAMFACWQIGAVVVNVNFQWTCEQLAYVASDAGASVAFIDSKRARELPDLPQPLKHVIVHGDLPNGRFLAWPTGAARAPAVPLLDIDLAAILYTSGSTGMPKGVVLTHTNLLVGARSVARFTAQQPDDRLLSLLPFSFDYGLNQLLTAFLVGARVVMSPLAMPSVVAQLLDGEAVTALAAVPPVWIQLVRYLEDAKVALPALRYVTNSGGAIPRPILEAMPRVFPGVRIHLMYGLTEAFRSTTLDPDKFDVKKGSIGRAVPNVETFVVVRGRGRAQPGEQGELVHRGSFISRGYWGKPEATADKIRSAPELADLIGDEKVVWSGDIVRVDEDGDLWFVGRDDSMIKSMGFRVSPTEVEGIVHRSGLVSEVVAFGVADELAGQVVEICVAHSSPVDVHAIEVHARAHMPHYMVPRRVHVWPGEFPRTASGKLDVTKVLTNLRVLSR
jgi:acyl-CoA synthetase (AMP-forming)/AMP-acid ligase II